VVSERVTHYNASVQVFGDGEANSRLVWIVDLLPNEIALYISGQMDQAALAMQQGLSPRLRHRQRDLARGSQIRFSPCSCGER
jgi:hypothetical protein